MADDTGELGGSSSIQDSFESLDNVAWGYNGRILCILVVKEQIDLEHDWIVHCPNADLLSIVFGHPVSILSAIFIDAFSSGKRKSNKFTFR